MASLVTDHMKTEGTKFLHECIPLAIEKDFKSELYTVKWEEIKTKKQFKEEFQTVLFAIGKNKFLHNFGCFFKHCNLLLFCGVLFLYFGKHS